MIVIIDYGVGNMGSISNMFRHLGIPSVVSSDPSVIEKADKLILPGVGSFDPGMKKLMERNFIGLLNDKVIVRKTPVLGICLGVQLFTRKSEEGTVPGLGWFEADAVKFEFGSNPQMLKIPHMGWSEVQFLKTSRLFSNMSGIPRFYFVHSYHLKTDRSGDVMCKSEYGYEFAAGLEKENIIGVQFHPEKSHKFGMQVFKNFSELY